MGKQTKNTYIVDQASRSQDIIVTMESIGAVHVFIQAGSKRDITIVMGQKKNHIMIVNLLYIDLFMMNMSPLQLPFFIWKIYFTCSALHSHT